MNDSSRDGQEVGVAHEVKLPENQPQFSQTTMEQFADSEKHWFGGYLLCIIKIVCIFFIETTLITEVLFGQFLILTAV